MQNKNSLKPDKKTFVSVVVENIKAIVIALIIALVIRAFVVQAFKIPSGSMLETLQIGDFLFVNKFIYGVRNPFSNKTIIPISKPKRGDIVVFEFPKDRTKDFIKRVAGVEGDRVKVINNHLFLNGKLIKENYIKNDNDFSYLENSSSFDASQSSTNFQEQVVPKDCYFMLGDNREKSYDSRFWGFVHKDLIVGKALIIYWSWDSYAPISKILNTIRWKRIGTLIND